MSGVESVFVKIDGNAHLLQHLLPLPASKIRVGDVQDPSAFLPCCFEYVVDRKLDAPLMSQYRDSFSHCSPRFPGFGGLHVWFDQFGFSSRHQLFKGLAHGFFLYDTCDAQDSPQHDHIGSLLIADLGFRQPDGVHVVNIDVVPIHIRVDDGGVDK